MTKEADLGPDDTALTAVDGLRKAKVFRHRVEFYKGESKSPLAVRRFEQGIYPIDADAGRSGLLLLCTSDEWGVIQSTGAEIGFCGAMSMSGRDVFRVKESEGTGSSRIPVGISNKGDRALFSITKARKDGDREVVGYRLWSKGAPSELLPADGTRTRAILEQFEGKLVLPDPKSGN